MAIPDPTGNPSLATNATQVRTTGAGSSGPGVVAPNPTVHLPPGLRTVHAVGGNPADPLVYGVNPNHPPPGVTPVTYQPGPGGASHLIPSVVKALGGTKVASGYGKGTGQFNPRPTVTVTPKPPSVASVAAKAAAAAAAAAREQQQDIAQQQAAWGKGGGKPVAATGGGTASVGGVTIPGMQMPGVVGFPKLVPIPGATLPTWTNVSPRMGASLVRPLYPTQYAYTPAINSLTARIAQLQQGGTPTAWLNAATNYETQQAQPQLNQIQQLLSSADQTLQQYGTSAAQMLGLIPGAEQDSYNNAIANNAGVTALLQSYATAQNPVTGGAEPQVGDQLSQQVLANQAATSYGGMAGQLGAYAIANNQVLQTELAQNQAYARELPQVTAAQIGQAMASQFNSAQTAIGKIDTAINKAAGTLANQIATGNLKTAGQLNTTLSKLITERQAQSNKTVDIYNKAGQFNAAATQKATTQNMTMRLHYNQYLLALGKATSQLQQNLASKNDTIKINAWKAYQGAVDAAARIYNAAVGAQGRLQVSALGKQPGSVTESNLIRITTWLAQHIRPSLRTVERPYQSTNPATGQTTWKIHSASEPTGGMTYTQAVDTVNNMGMTGDAAYAQVNTYFRSIGYQGRGFEGTAAGQALGANTSIGEATFSGTNAKGQVVQSAPTPYISAQQAQTLFQASSNGQQLLTLNPDHTATLTETGQMLVPHQGANGQIVYVIYPSASTAPSGYLSATT
jgi:hypothetical protein